MSTKSRQTIYGGAIMGAKIRAESARKHAAEAAREADRAEAEAWSIQMEGYGGPGLSSPASGAAMAEGNHMAGKAGWACICAKQGAESGDQTHI